jgi:chromosomal replication initiator protein
MMNFPFLNSNENNTFETFFKFESNKLALLTSLEVAESPGLTFNPLYLYAKMSLGKTHLLNSIMNKIKTQNPVFKVGYTSATRFSECISNCKSPDSIKAIHRYCSTLDMLLFDDVDFLSDKDVSQREFISLFDILYQRGKQIVVAAKVPPGQVKTFIPGFRSRLAWGMLSEIESPDLPSKIFFFKNKLLSYNIIIPDDIVFFICKKCLDFKELNNEICELKNNKTLPKHIYSKNLNKKIIIDKVMTYFNITSNELYSNKKNKIYSYPRHIAMYLIKIKCNLSYKDIAIVFNKKDHSTIINAVNKIKKHIN